MRMLAKTMLASLLVSASAGTLAQGVHTNQQLSAALANELVGETVTLCASRGYKVWAVVVNLDGVRIAVLRGDGAPIHSQDNAYYKAYTAASLTLARNENSIKEIADRMAKAAPTTVPQITVPNVTYAQGAIVIRNADKQVIGSIGVSGAPGGALDEACASDALAKIQARIK